MSEFIEVYTLVFHPPQKKYNPSSAVYSIFGSRIFFPNANGDSLSPHHNQEEMH